jgi:hypothetical protein
VGRSRRLQPHEFHCRRICHERRKLTSKSSLLFWRRRRARRRPTVRRKKPGVPALSVVASAAKQFTFPRDNPSQRWRHGLRSQLLLRIAASGGRYSVKSGEASTASEGSGFLEGEGRAGEGTAGSHTNSTVDVNAMNGVSVQAIVHFCSCLAQGAAASESTAKTAGWNRSPRHCERSDAIHLSTRHSLEAHAPPVA